MKIMEEKIMNLKLHEINLKYHPKGNIISGGVMEGGKYCLINNRTMMLMKEVNDLSEKFDWNLPGLLTSIYKKECTYYRMWKNVSRWAICTQMPEISYEDINHEHLFEGLKLFATTNLKKSGGPGKSDYNDIMEHAQNNKDEWMEEIEILDPTLIICAGTFDIVKVVIAVDDIVKVCKSGARYFIKDNRIYLDFVHPAYQVSDKLMFAFFKETYRSLLEQNCFKKN